MKLRFCMSSKIRVHLLYMIHRGVNEAGFLQVWLKDLLPRQQLKIHFKLPLKKPKYPGAVKLRHSNKRGPDTTTNCAQLSCSSAASYDSTQFRFLYKIFIEIFSHQISLTILKKYKWFRKLNKTVYVR